MRELIRHILKENNLKQELKKVIEDDNIFKAADLVGGMDNLKSIFKDEPEMSSLFEKLTGKVTFYYPLGGEDDIEFPLDYEIIGRRSNVHNTNHWPEINVIYDENKLTPEENEVFIQMIKFLVDLGQHSGFKSKFNDGRIFNANYLTVLELNGEDINLIDEVISFEQEDSEYLHNKLYGESKSLNESDNRETDKNLRAINVLLSLVSWDGLCDIWAEYNPDDKEYEIRSKTTVRHFDSDEVFKELGSLEDSIKSMGIRVYIFSPWYVDNCDDEVKFMNESSNRSEKDTKKLFKITKMIMEDMILPEYNHIICSYEITLNEVFNIPEVTVLFIGGYGTKLWPITQGIRQMYLNVLEDISKEIANYTGVVIGVRGEQTPKCDDKENIYLRESKSENKEYSPAGKEITPKEKIYHQSNPMFRNKIEEQGLRVRAGECYKIYVGYGEKCIPAIFATNSSNKRAWFDSTYDDDVWEIDTTKIPNVKWYKDRHFESRSKHIVTFENIPRDAIKLIYEGSGKDSGLMESENKSEDKKLKLVKEMIYSLFDEVEFIEVDTNYQGKPLIKIYHDVEDTAANYDNWLQHQIRDKIQEITGDGIILSPWWAPEWDINKKLADFYIDAQKIEYDDEGNVINESENKKSNYLDLIKKLVEPFKNEVGVCDIKASYDDDDDMYSVYIVTGTEEMNDKFFYVPMIQSHISKLRINVKTTIKDYLPIDNLYVGSYGKPNCGWKPINESDNKEQSLKKLIDQYGLYVFMKMTGLDFNQVKSILNKMDNPKELLKQYISEFVLEHGGSTGENYGSLFALQIPLSDTKYVEDIIVHGDNSIALEIWEYHLDEYGHREQKDQYLTTINSLTNDELLSIISWMMEVIEEGHWD